MPSTGRLRYLDLPGKLVTDAGSRGRAVGTLVLIHGFPLSARMWEPQLAIAAGGWRVIAPQLRGFDGGAGDPPAESMDDYAGDVVDLLDTLHVENAVIGGLSMGGYVTLAVFRNAPRYFRGMVLADTRSQADTPEAVQARQKMLALAADKGAPAVADEMLPKLVGASTQRDRPDVVEHVKTLILTNSTTAISGALKAMMTRPDSTPLLSGIHVPTLILVGEEDALTPPAMSESMHQGIAGSELVRIPGAGHMSNLERPELFNAALARFLSHRV
jgi:pimeloyl-ACP methyl ester carboxylesterase